MKELLIELHQQPAIIRIGYYLVFAFVAALVIRIILIILGQIRYALCDHDPSIYLGNGRRKCSKCGKEAFKTHFW